MDLNNCGVGIPSKIQQPNWCHCSYVNAEKRTTKLLNKGTMTVRHNTGPLGVWRGGAGVVPRQITFDLWTDVKPYIWEPFIDKPVQRGYDQISTSNRALLVELCTNKTLRTLSAVNKTSRTRFPETPQRAVILTSLGSCGFSQNKKWGRKKSRSNYILAD